VGGEVWGPDLWVYWIGNHHRRILPSKKDSRGNGRKTSAWTPIGRGDKVAGAWVVMGVKGGKKGRGGKLTKWNYKQDKAKEISKDRREGRKRGAAGNGKVKFW